MRVLEVCHLSDDLSGLRLAERAMPEPGAGEVLIRIEAAALGWPDLLMTAGAYQAKPALPYVPGMECAGTVIACGPDVSGWQPGARVIAGGTTGAVAQFGVFPASSLMALPDTMSFARGAAFRVAYLTAWVSLVRLGRAQAGEWVVVHGAGGGVGLATVDLARALGLKTIAVASSADKLAAITAHAAPDLALIGPTGIREAVLEATGGRGADLVFDPVGGDVFDEACRYTAFAGRLLVVGFAGGHAATLPTNIALIKGLQVIGVRAGEYGRRFPGHGREHLAAIADLAARGAVHPHVHAAVPLDRWREAFAAMRERRVIGRTVILPHG